MGDERYEIFDILESNSIITKEIYDELISKYDKKIVDEIIKNQIDETTIDKYEYFINDKLEEHRDNFNTSYDIYINDMIKYKKFDKFDNMKYFTILSEIAGELNEIFDSSCVHMMNGLSIYRKVDLFINKIDDINSLSKVKYLYEKYIEVRNIIVNGNLSLVVALSKQYFKDNLDNLEIIQNGNEGLMHAIDKYDVEKDVSFATYACYWIKQNIIMGLKHFNTPIKVPDYIFYLNGIRLKTINELTDELGREPVDNEIAKRMNISISKLKEIKFSFENIMSISDLEVLEYNDCVDSDILIDMDSDFFEEYVEKEKSVEILKKMKENLTDIEYNILVRRFGLENHEISKYDDIGFSLGMTGENVRLIQKKALGKLKTKCPDLSIYW